jgi:hypothetical protein
MLATETGERPASVALDHLDFDGRERLVLFVRLGVFFEELLDEHEALREAAVLEGLVHLC